MRAAQTKADHQLDEALIWDFFGERYGWTPDDVKDRLPWWLPSALVTLAEVRLELAREEAYRNEN